MSIVAATFDIMPEMDAVINAFKNQETIMPIEFDNLTPDQQLHLRAFLQVSQEGAVGGVAPAQDHGVLRDAAARYSLANGANEQQIARLARFLITGSFEA